MKLIYENADCFPIRPIPGGFRVINVGDEVWVGDIVTLNPEHTKHRVTDIITPHSPASTGRVYVEEIQMDPHTHTRLKAAGFFPNVIGAKWIEREDRRSTGPEVPL